MTDQLRRRGARFVAQLRRDSAARSDAKATVSQLPDGTWGAVVGGRQRGHVVTGRTRRDVIDQIDDHYNRAMLAFVENGSR